MISRRRLLCLPAALAAARRYPVGLALSSLAPLLRRDVTAALDVAARLGFQEVEAPELFGLSPAQFRVELRTAGLQCAALEVDGRSIGDRFEAAADDAAVLGAGHLVCIRLAESGERRAAEWLNRFGRAAAARGVRLVHQPCIEEWKAAGSGAGFEALAAASDPACVDFQLHTAHAAMAGRDPKALLEIHPHRFTRLRLRDVPKAGKAAAPGAPLGQGRLNLRAILAAARSAHLRHYSVEDEGPNAIAHIRQGLRYLDSLSPAG